MGLDPRLKDRFPVRRNCILARFLRTRVLAIEEERPLRARFDERNRCGMRESLGWSGRLLRECDRRRRHEHGAQIGLHDPRALDETRDFVSHLLTLVLPALRHVGPVRRELAVPTVMNIVGPLANPARAGRQVVGVAEHSRLGLLADALSAVGTVRAMVVHGEPGLDEVSPLGPTHVIEVRAGRTASWTIDPAAHGISGISLNDLVGGDPAQNAALIEDVLGGGGSAGAQAAVLLNAAAAVYVSGDERSYAEAVTMTRRAMAEGVGLAALQRLRAASNAALDATRR